MEDIKKLIRDVPDFPKEGILFRDITTLLKDPAGLKRVVDVLADRYKDKGIHYVVGAESRGFIFGSLVAHAIGAGFILVRKPGKLPCDKHSVSYELEYGTDSIEMHTDAIEHGKNVLIIDDLLATGGTAGAMVELVKRAGGNIHELAFVIELEGLKGRDKLEGHNIFSMIKY